MSELKLQIVNDDKIPVECEFESLNQMMRDAYWKTLTKQATAYRILVDGIVIGGCMIQFVRILDEEFDDDEWYPAIEIAYLVIREDCRKHGIGRSVLAMLVQEIKHLSDRYPIRFLVLEAFQGLESWYEKTGFQKYETRTDIQYTHTISMRMDLINRDKVEEYEQQFG